MTTETEWLDTVNVAQVRPLAALHAYSVVYILIFSFQKTWPDVPESLFAQTLTEAVKEHRRREGNGPFTA